MALIFISHSSKDKDKSTQIKNQIEEAGFDSVFLDHDVDRGIQTGEEWEQRLYAEIRSSHIMLLLLSPAWAESKWCFAEYTHAKSSGKEIIPLVIEQGSQEEMLQWIASYLQYSDITQNSTALEQVIRRIREITLRTQSGFEWDKNRSPYPGMVSFEEEDASIFFARDEECSQGITLLKSMKTKNSPKSLMLVGASGMGKSSLLKAGIIPNLKKYHKNEWAILPTLTPSKNPIKDFVQIMTKFLQEDKTYYKSLYSKLEDDNYKETLDDLMLELELEPHISTHSSFLLPIDQAENLYTTAETTYRSFFICLLQYLMLHHKNFFIIWTLRSDFLKDFQSDREMESIIANNQIQTLTHINAENIIDIISKPAQIVGVEIEKNLIEKIKIDMQTTDALPLVALALSELYEQHKKHHQPTITLETYQTLSKDKTTNPLESIIQQKAEEAIEKFTDTKSLKALKNAFIPHLVRIGEQGQYIKRVANENELPQESHKAIDQLIEARLLIKSSKENEIYIEVSHEALIRKWSRLQAWLVEEQEFLIGKSQLELDLLAYQKEEKDKSKAYLAGLRLQKASVWLEENFDQLNGDEREYISKSIAYEYQEKQKRKRWVVGSFVVIILFGLFAGWQWMESQKNLIVAVEEKRKAKLSEEASQKAEVKAKEELVRAEHNLGLALIEKAKVFLKEKDYTTANYYAYKALLTLNSQLDKRQQIVFTRNLIMNNKYNGVMYKLQSDKFIGSIITISNDGKEAILSSGLKGNIMIWNREKNERKVKFIFKKHTSPIKSALFSKDKKTIILGSTNGTIIILDRKKRKILSILKGHTKSVMSIVLSKDEKIIISSSLDKTIRVWDMESGQLISIFKHTEMVYNALLSSDEKTIISLSRDNIRVWDIESGKLLSIIKRDTPQYYSFSTLLPRDGKTIITVSGNSIKIYDIKNGKVLSIFKGHTDVIYSIALSEDEKTIVSGSRDSSIRLWNRENGKLLSVIKGQKGIVDNIKFFKNKTIISNSGTTGKNIKIYNKDSPKILYGHKKPINSIIFSNNEKTIISASRDNSIRIWDRESSKMLSILKGHTDSVNTILASLDEKTIISGSDDRTIRIWDRNSGKVKSILKGHKGSVNSIALSSDEKTIISSSSDGTIRIWDRDSGKVKFVLKGYIENIKILYYNNIETIVSYSNDNIIRIWNIASGKLLSKSKRNRNLIDEIIIDYNTKIIVSFTAWGNNIRVWDIESGKLISELKGHTHSVNNIIISSDGKTLISSSHDGTIRVWDINNTKLLAIFNWHTNIIVSSILLSDDEKTLISSSHDGTIRVWDISQVRKLQNPNYIKQQIKALETQLQMKLEGVFLVPLDKK